VFESLSNAVETSPTESLRAVREPKTTVICAVYSRDPDRAALVRQHAANLRAQTVAVNAIYVFEAGDTPPDNLGFDTIVASRALTIYEAWNVALSMCNTHFVMNLNLDDRLHANAVETLEAEIQKRQVDLVGGDWRICYSQAETDDVRDACYSIEELPFVPQWPPESGAATRLGSGTGERPTYGPATLWRLTAHVRFPRYPYRAADGYRIRTIGDGVWWGLLRQRGNDNLVRIAQVIGNYHSHPQTQAEFRSPADREWAHVKAKGLSLV
jgi:hypothetical protein